MTDEGFVYIFAQLEGGGEKLGIVYSQLWEANIINFWKFFIASEEEGGFIQNMA